MAASSSSPPSGSPPSGSLPTFPPAKVGERDERWQIRIRNLKKRFGPQQVLDGIDLDIERGKTNIIIGGSGQGKSVLMKHLMGLLKPDSGQILVDGQDLVPLTELQLNPVRKKFGMVFQYAALFDSMTVMENIAFPLLERYRLRKDEIEKRVRDLLDRLGLGQVPGIEMKFPAQLSGGQRKRVGLARALIDRPQILLYDEPTTGLDPIATKNVDDMIRQTADDFGVTSVVISHDMASTFRIGDRISMLHAGKIVVHGIPADVLKSDLPILREFLFNANMGGHGGGTETREAEVTKVAPKPGRSNPSGGAS
jgi:phospholipid/cholesterol/gamma-HCH transport system ATP-binding protein